MALDGIQLNPGAGGSFIASDLINQTSHELVKIEFGTEGNATMVSGSNPLPVIDNEAIAVIESVETTLTDGTQKTQVVLGNGQGMEATIAYQADLLSLILNELQEQTKILKKIYQ